jgi:hypothetical protein
MKDFLGEGRNPLIKIMATKKQLENLKKGRMIRQMKLKNQPQQKKLVFIPRKNIVRGIPLSDIDCREGLFTSIDDVVPRPLQRRSR